MANTQSNTVSFIVEIANVFAPEITVEFDLAIRDKVNLKENPPNNLPPGFTENYKLEV